MARRLKGRQLVGGAAKGKALVSSEPLSFWGGYDAASGEIIDRRHPLSGRMAAGCVLVLPSAKGSSTTAAVLLEAIRRKTAPVAIVTQGTDVFFALASVVADEMYRTPLPVVALESADFELLSSGQLLDLPGDGSVRIEPPGDENPPA